MTFKVLHFRWNDCIVWVKVNVKKRVTSFWRRCWEYSWDYKLFILFVMQEEFYLRSTMRQGRRHRQHVWCFPQTAGLVTWPKISLAGVWRSRSQRQVSVFTFWFNGKVLSILLVNCAVLKLNNTIYLIRFKLNNNIYLIRFKLNNNIYLIMDTAADWELNTK